MVCRREIVKSGAARRFINHPISSKRTKPEILVFTVTATGGLAEYIFCQAEAIAKLGFPVTLLSAPGFLSGREILFARRLFLTGLIEGKAGSVLNRLALFWNIVISQFNLVWHILKRRPDLVLLDNYLEYLSPFWIWPHWLLARCFKVRYAANLHDPVRSYVVGPVWWHRWSVSLAYKPLEFVTLHETLSDPAVVPSTVRTVQVPHGLFQMSGAGPDAASVRREWGVAPGQNVFLAFGFVRNGKNLDLSIRALAAVPEAFLVVAGSVASPKDRQFADYRTLAADVGVADRCRFFEGFVSDADLGKYFTGTDYILLTYSSSFHSQSGVLNLAARARKPVLASASPSALLQTVRHYGLGLVVEPDSLEAIILGMKSLLLKPPQPRWNDYEASASWSVNAREVLKAAGFLVE